MEFAYRGRDHAGALHEGQIAVESREEAALALQQKGVIPVSLDEVVERFDPIVAINRYLEDRARVDTEELIVFCRQMYALARAGIPIVRAIRGLADSSGSDSTSLHSTPTCPRAWERR